MSKRRELAIVVVAAGLVGVAVVCGMKPGRSADAVLERFEAQQPHMGTIFRIVVYAADEKQARQACQAAFQRIAQLDNTMSDYKEDSELMRVCREAAGKPVKVSPDLFAVLVAAQEIAQASDGAFDVTIGPVVRLWRRARRQQQLPDAKRLEMARQLVGYQKLRLDRQHQTVELAQPGMILDLGGIGKGYAADAALAVLAQHGLPRALVAAGGDIRVGEPPPHASGWKVAIAGIEDGSRATEYLLLRQAAVSTSGDLEQFVEIGGRRYSHIVDPRTGQALVGRRSATVVAPTGTQSDAWATTLCVLGPEKGLPLVEKQAGFAARFLLADDTAKSSAGEPKSPTGRDTVPVRVFTTSNWTKLPRP